ncbi:hypothetical protein HDU98_007306 [Podochytrium sp. JEL0797]|nr:hypothetical protein HDU98_007306 [Podochytrium sp. JEL0797]
MNDILHVMPTPIDISPSMEYKSLLAACSPHSVGGNGNMNGHKLLKAGSPVLRLVLAKTRETDQFVVLFSLSHTFTNDVVNPRACFLSPAVLRFGSSLTFIKASVMGMFRKPPATAMAYFVDESKVTMAKRKCVADESNDLLTSHYITACSPVRLGLMTINYCPRCARILDSNFMGNYEESVV